MCLKCAKNYARQSDTCNKCEATIGSQIAVMCGASVGGIAMFTYVIYSTIKGKGNPRDIKSGILKIVLRQFQLTGIISQFPLAWSNEIKTMFSFLNIASNAGSDAFSMDCFMSLNYQFTINSIITFLIPIINVLIFAFGILIKFKFDIKNAKCQRYMVISTIVILMTCK